MTQKINKFSIVILIIIAAAAGSAFWKDTNPQIDQNCGGVIPVASQEVSASQSSSSPAQYKNTIDSKSVVVEVKQDDYFEAVESAKTYFDKNGTVSSFTKNSCNSSLIAAVKKGKIDEVRTEINSLGDLVSDSLESTDVNSPTKYLKQNIDDEEKKLSELNKTLSSTKDTKTKAKLQNQIDTLKTSISSKKAQLETVNKQIQNVTISVQINKSIQVDDGFVSVVKDKLKNMLFSIVALLIFIIPLMIIASIVSKLTKKPQSMKNENPQTRIKRETTSSVEKKVPTKVVKKKRIVTEEK